MVISVTDLVDESLSGPTLAAVGEGLTEEELELAKQILEVRQTVCSLTHQSFATMSHCALQGYRIVGILVLFLVKPDLY